MALALWALELRSRRDLAAQRAVARDWSALANSLLCWREAAVEVVAVQRRIASWRGLWVLRRTAVALDGWSAYTVLQCSTRRRLLKAQALVVCVCVV